ncbi:hypothetical protein EDD85DRAFT_790264 [Armillaria nabsnona]|nr:hypothetical protein EDD85DRAFT_790264 [Armillaria nabsnona]
MAGVVIEGMGILHGETDGPSIVVAGKNGREGVGVVFTPTERLGREVDLTNRFLDVENEAGEVVAMVEKLWGRISGSEPRDGDGVLAHGRLVFPDVQNGGYGKMGWLGWLHGAGDTNVGAWLGGQRVTIFIPPSSSTSPALQCPPFTFPFSSMLPPDSPRAPHQTTTITACPAIVAVIVLVVIVMANSTFNSSSHAEMVTNVQCPDALHTLVVYGCCGWWRLAPMSMWAMRVVVIAVAVGDIVVVVKGHSTWGSLI